ncbi:MAG: adenylyltransferase/cytidyltransferase family protein [Candidatus Berkelbacteria bacterium]
MKTDKKIIKYSEVTKVRDQLKSKGKSTVLTTGCYDILHLGHVIHFNYCKSKGDILFVSVGNDATIRNLKGPTRPINNEKLRTRLVAALDTVDYVVLSEEVGEKMDHNILMDLLKPNAYVVPVTDSSLEAKKQLCDQYGTKFITCHRLPPEKIKGGISSTKISEKIGEKQ